MSRLGANVVGIDASKKNIAEQKKSQISKEIEMFDKTIDVIKNLKKF